MGEIIFAQNPRFFDNTIQDGTSVILNKYTINVLISMYDTLAPTKTWIDSLPLFVPLKYVIRYMILG